MSKQADFYGSVYSTAKQLGANDVQAHLAASQASLETGYGDHVAGNNYFGIKAGSSYKGPSVNTGTHEVINGQSVAMKDNFRSYQGLADSVKGYMDFMGRAFPDSWNADNITDAAKSLTNGKFGAYATDPKYKSKVESIASQFGATEMADQFQPSQVSQETAVPSNWNASQGLQGLLSYQDPAQPDIASQAIDNQMPSLPTDASAYDQVTMTDLPAAMDVSRGILGGLPAAQEMSPAINSVADPMQAASMGAYTDNGLTNSSGFGPVSAEVVNPTAINSQAVNPAFSPSGFYAATPQSTIGGDIPQGLMSQPSYNQPANNNLDPAFSQSGLLNAAPQQTMGLLGNQAQAYNPGMLFDSTLAQVAPEFSVQPQTQVQQVQPDIQQTAIRGPSNIAAVQQQAVQNVQAPQQQEQPQTLADKVFSKGTAGQLGGGLLGGMVLGPVGGILGAIAGRHMMENGGLGSLGGLLSSQPLDINNIGGGMTNVGSVYGGADRGTQASANNGGKVTSLGGGRVAYTSPSGVTTISNSDGTGQSADWSSNVY